MPRDKRIELSSNANIGIRVRYITKMKDYHVWLLEDPCLVETVHVKMYESRNLVLTLFGLKSSECNHFFGINYFLEKPTYCFI